jgi:uncharacterized protein YdgA (DUF945 family)
MKKPLLISAVAIVLLSATAAALPWWFGQETEKAMRALLKASADHGELGAELVRYERGWLRTTAETVHRHPTAPLEIRVTHRIHHGPLPFGQGGPSGIQLARVESRLSLHSSDARLQTELQQFPAIESDTAIGLDGMGAMRLQQPAWTRPGQPSLVWDGLRGEVQFDRELKTLKSDVRMPGARLMQERTEFLRVDNLRFKSALRRGVADLYLGDSDFTVESFRLRPPPPSAPVELHELRFDNRMRAGSPETVDMTLHYTLKELRLNGGRHGPSEILIEVRRLDAAALKGFEKQIKQMAQRGAPLEQTSLVAVGKSLELLGILSRRSPELEIRRLSIKSDMGELTGRGKLVVDGSRANIAENPLLFLTATRGEFELRVPAGYVRPLLAPLIRQDLQTLGRGRLVRREDMNALSPERINAIIDESLPHYLSRHPLTRLLAADGDHYRLHAALQRGELLNNGRPWAGGTPLPLAQPAQ